ncbi:MAG TPA: molybdopterin-dependent oxidoreductase, partial [Urbifossiella sp.]|nr:molybdopterin-dependent oxidoreductase [Urbifossiella sp.]
QVSALLKQELAAHEKWTVVLSPFLTVEEAYLLAEAFQNRSPRLVLGPVPVIGEDDRYPKDVKGNAVDPTKFTIRAEKCPNRAGVEAVLTHLQGSVIPFADVAREPLDAVWFAGGYPEAGHAEGGIPADWKAPALLVAQDLFPSLVTAAAKYVLPGTASFEKDGTFVNHAGLAQSFARATRPPVESRTELQLAYDLLGLKGLAQAAVVRKDLAASIPGLAALGGEVPANGVKVGG